MDDNSTIGSQAQDTYGELLALCSNLKERDLLDRRNCITTALHAIRVSVQEIVGKCQEDYEDSFERDGRLEGRQLLLESQAWQAQPQPQNFKFGPSPT